MKRFNDYGNDLMAMVDCVLSPVQLRNAGIRADFKATDECYEATINMPGVKKEDIELKFESGYLIVSATQKTEDEDNGEGYLLRERSVVSFERSFSIGEDVKNDEIKASYTDGVLKVTMPRIPKPPVKDNSIKID